MIMQLYTMCIRKKDKLLSLTISYNSIFILYKSTSSIRKYLNLARQEHKKHVVLAASCTNKPNAYPRHI